MPQFILYGQYTPHTILLNSYRACISVFEKEKLVAVWVLFTIFTSWTINFNVPDYNVTMLLSEIQFSTRGFYWFIKFYLSVHTRQVSTDWSAVLSQVRRPWNFNG